MSSFQLLHFLYYRGSTASTVDLKEGSVIHSRWVGWGVVSVNDRGFMFQITFWSILA